MSGRKFLIDRIGYVVLFFATMYLALLVVRLDLALTDSSLSRSNLVYIGVLACTSVAGFLLFDWLRRKTFYTGLERVRAGKELADSFAYAPPRLYEEHLVADTLTEQYARYTDLLLQLKNQQELQNRFLIRWAHQMKTPLAIIDLLLQEQEQEQSVGNEFTASMREELDKLTHGLQLALSDARLKQFNLDFTVEQVDIVACLREVVNDHKKAFIRGHIYPRIVSPTSSIFVETDAKWIHFVMTQLVANAIKYSCADENQSSEVVLSVVPEVDAWVVEVCDQGVGIVGEDLPRVFEPFFTGHNGRQFRESTGMGLHLAHEVCKRLGLGLSVTSEVGHGSIFCVAFPHSKNLLSVLGDKNVS